MQNHGREPPSVDERGHAGSVKALLVIGLVVVVIGAGMKMAGMDVPLIDYPVGPFGEGQGPIMPRIEVDPPGFNEFEAP